MYEVRTPVLAEVIASTRETRAGLRGGSLDPKDARELIRNDGTAISAVKADVAARLAAPKIAAYEAKLIESESDQRKQLAA